MKKTLVLPTKSLTVLATCITLMLSSATYANDIQNTGKKLKENHHQMKKGHLFKGMMKQLKLTDEQKKHVKNIRDNAKSENEALFLQLKSFKGKEKTLLQAYTFDEQAYISLLNEYQSVRSQLALNKAKNKHAFRLLLSDVQKEKLDNHKQRSVKKSSL